MKRNANMSRLKANYLFPEVNLRKKQFLAQHPEASLISLGIGDTTEPVPESIVESLVDAAAALGSAEGYTGYGPEQGVNSCERKSPQSCMGTLFALKKCLYPMCKMRFRRLQMLFGCDVSIAVQDPSTQCISMEV